MTWLNRSWKLFIVRPPQIPLRRSDRCCFLFFDEFVRRKRKRERGSYLLGDSICPKTKRKEYVLHFMFSQLNFPLFIMVLWNTHAAALLRGYFSAWSNLKPWNCQLFLSAHIHFIRHIAHELESSFWCYKLLPLFTLCQAAEISAEKKRPATECLMYQ